MTALPTEPGSVIGWCGLDDDTRVAVCGDGGLWWESGSELAYTASELSATLFLMAADAWWYMGRVTPDGITTTR